MSAFLVWMAVHASQYLVFVYFLAVNSIYTALIVLAMRDIVRHAYLSTARAARRQLAGEFYYKPVSVIVPAHNEAAVIIQSVRALLNLHYPEFEVIVVNDGSSDATLAVLAAEFGLLPSARPVRLQVPHEEIRALYRSSSYPNLLIVDKANGGKADAINAGVNVSSFPIFCSIDADSLLEPDALLKSSKLFLEDDSLIATGGIIRILNGCRVEGGAVTEIALPSGTLEAMQVLEYTRAFLSGRTGWNALNSLLIISGAFGVFRKDMVVAVGGYRRTVGEDMDLVMRLHRHCHEHDIPYKILFVPDPVCWTQAPFSLNMLLKQRNRWHRGMIDALLYNRSMILNPKYGATSLIGISYFVFVELLGPLIELFGYAAIPVLYLFGLLNFRFFVMLVLLAVLWGISINVGAIFLDIYNFRRYRKTSDILRLCVLAALEFFGYRQLMLVERLKATVFFRKRDWGQQDRRVIDASSDKGRRPDVAGSGTGGFGPALFLYDWLCSAFFLGTLALMGPVRWLVRYYRSAGIGYSAEKFSVMAAIAALAAVSLLAAVLLSRLSARAAGGRRKALLWTPAAVFLLSLGLWLNPRLMTDRNAGGPGESVAGAEFEFGPYPDEEKLRLLKSEGYTAVVSLLSQAVVPFEPVLLAREKEEAREAGMELVHIPMLPWVSANDGAEKGIAALLKRGGGKYYVHCYLGKDRVNVFRRMLASASGVAGAPAAGARSLDGLPAMERGPVVRLEKDVFFLPYPTDEEFFGYVFGGGVRTLVSLLDPADPEEGPLLEKERGAAARYGVKFADFPWRRLDRSGKRKAAAAVRGMERPLAVNAYGAGAPGYSDFPEFYAGKR
ncbi:MAG: glycosyltransferase [Elusimicrobia bacterium]|nr:glycosyltransferase [Elusimicrobiota bacterium]